jgi:hypothetical protein
MRCQWRTRAKTYRRAYTFGMTPRTGERRTNADLQPRSWFGFGSTIKELDRPHFICVSDSAHCKYVYSICNVYSVLIRERICMLLIQLWGTASTSDIELPERFQSKALSMIVGARWYVPNTVIRRDLQIPTIKEEIRRYSSQYSARLSAHPNNLIVNLMEKPDNRRLRRHLPNDLPTRVLLQLLYL